MTLTKIICTIGPKTESEHTLSQLMDAGMTIARLNFSHSNHEWFQAVIDRIKKIREEKKARCAMLLDTKGPEIRTADMPLEVEFKKGKKYTIGPVGSGANLEVTYPFVVRDCKKGQIIQLDGGLLQATVEGTKDGLLLVTSEGDHVLTPRRHVNIPGIHLELPVLSDKDKKDIAFGIEAGIDLIAASFINTGKDIQIIKKEVSKHTERHIPIIAKIESQTGLDNIDAILAEADGIMVARGDLGVEVPIHLIPKIQKMLVEKAFLARKPVIIATQMLTSMVANPTPTRAEITDVGNAIYSSVDAIMLSEESSMGAYPVECVTLMSEIANSIEPEVSGGYFADCWDMDQDGHMLANGVQLASSVDADALVLVTDSQERVLLLSQLRPMMPIYVFTNSEVVLSYSNLLRGVRAFKQKKTDILSRMEKIDGVLNQLHERRLLKKKSKVVLFFSIMDQDQRLDTVQVREIE